MKNENLLGELNKHGSAHHADDVAVDGLREDAPAGGDVVHDLVEGGALDLLPLQGRRDESNHVRS